MTNADVAPVLDDKTAVIRVPGSKSVANRALVIAALASGTSSISNLPKGDDTQAMIDALVELGVSVAFIRDGTVEISGPINPRAGAVLNARLAGTTSRFLLALGALCDVPITVTGDEPLRNRPIGDLVDALRYLGMVIEPQDSRSLPLSVSKPSEVNRIGSVVTVPGDVSSQFISALMMIGPWLPQGLTIHIEGDLVSRSYVEMTAAVMAEFGATVSVADHVIVVNSGEYTARSYGVEPDYSSAAFPIAAAVIGSRTVRIPGLANSNLQGDARILDIVAQMGAIVQLDGEDVVVTGPVDSHIRGIRIDMSDCSDLVPAVAVVASFATEDSVLSGIGFIRAKESDRLGDLAAELSKTGANVAVMGDGLRILPCTDRRGASIDTHHDHRMAMSMALLGLRIEGIVIRDIGVVSKSWPHYWSDMASLVTLKNGHESLSRTPRRALVAFDLDHTLTTRDCVLPFFMRVVGPFRFCGIVFKNLPRISSLIMRRRRDGLKELLVREVFKGRDITEVDGIGEQFATHVADRWMREDTCRALKWHQATGDVVVLVTASLHPYVRPLAQKLGVHHVLCSELQDEGGQYTGEMIEGNCRSAEKARRIIEWAQAHRLHISNGDTRNSSYVLDYAYGDSAGDNEMLAIAIHGLRVKRRDISLDNLMLFELTDDLTAPRAQ